MTKSIYLVKKVASPMKATGLQELINSKRKQVVASEKSVSVKRV